MPIGPATWPSGRSSLRSTPGGTALSTTASGLPGGAARRLRRRPPTARRPQMRGRRRRRTENARAGARAGIAAARRGGECPSRATGRSARTRRGRSSASGTALLAPRTPGWRGGWAATPRRCTRFQTTRATGAWRRLGRRSLGTSTGCSLRWRRTPGRRVWRRSTQATSPSCSSSTTPSTSTSFPSPRSPPITSRSSAGGASPCRSGRPLPSSTGTVCTACPATCTRMRVGWRRSWRR
mmetsp:Transcript_81203/g.241956  ORF Transcript_81203/g.241956 Transcript_81203/m.241956 type:complete len:238 (+) Transcript_81203:509-1222(+)